MILPPSLASLTEGARVEPVLAGEAGASVYRMAWPDGRVNYLKHGVGRIADDVADEAHRLAWLQGRVPCGELIHFTCAGGSSWLLTNSVAGQTGDGWVEQDAAHLPMVIGAFASFLRQLHALPIDNCPFNAGAGVRMAAARRLIDAGLVNTDDFDDDHAGWTAEKMWDELVALRPNVSDRVVTHGDFSLGNLLIDANGDVCGCIDVGRLGVADPYQDIAILWQNLREFGDDACEQFLTAYGLCQVDDRRLLFHRCLDELF